MIITMSLRSSENNCKYPGIVRSAKMSEEEHRRRLRLCEILEWDNDHVPIQSNWFWMGSCFTFDLITNFIGKFMVMGGSKDNTNIRRKKIAIFPQSCSMHQMEFSDGIEAGLISYWKYSWFPNIYRLNAGNIRFFNECWMIHLALYFA